MCSTPPTIERLMGHWGQLLAGAVADPSMATGALPLISAGERELVLQEWASTPVDGSPTPPAGVAASRRAGRACGCWRRPTPWRSSTVASS